jgi:predicted nucleic acid-binding protein
MRVFLDANVLFSAAKSDGAMNELLALPARAGHECRADDYVIEEARRNLLAKSPERMQALDRILSRMRTAATRRVDAALEASLPLPPKDRPVLAAAIHCRWNALVTGDRTHFGALYGRTIHGVGVHLPRSLAKAIGRASG